MGETPTILPPRTRLFHDVLNASPIGIAIENLEGQPLFVNPALCSMLGFSAEELRSKHCVDFSPPEDAQEDWELFQKLKAGLIDHYQLEKRYFRRDGSFLWGRLSLSLLNSRPSPLVIAMVEDITEKKTAEEIRYRLAAIVESSDDAIISTTGDGIIVSWNAGAQNIYGYIEAEALGKPISMLLPPERDAEKEVFERLRAGGHIEHFETIRVTKTGKKISVSLSVSPIKDSRGRVVGTSGISRDITERKRTDEALHESEERLRLAVQAGRMFAYSWDAASDVIERSGESAEILGVRNDQARTGAAMAAMVHPDDRQKLEAALAKLTAENPALQITYRITRTHGAVTWLEQNSRAYFGAQGELKRIVGMTVDVTERKMAEEALRASEERLRMAQSAARIAAFEWNIRTGVNTWTPELEAMYGLPPGGFAGTQTAFENLVHPDDRAGVIELVDAAMKTGQPTKGEWRVVWSDGSVHWIVGRFQVFMNESGEPLRMVGVNIDVSDRKRAEQALAEMTRNLIKAQEHERARIGRGLHDDINQRLAMLAVELEQLQEIAPDARRRIQELRKQTTEISNDVQALSHDLHSSKLEYLGVVAGIRSWCREFAERQKMQIHFKGDVRSLLPLEVGISLFRILQEALHNVIKHSRAKRAEVQLREEYGEIHLLVSDSGKGFDVESAMKGRGLGLTSMRERVRLLGGTIVIDSKMMAGTTIHVRVPLKSEPDAQMMAG